MVITETITRTIKLTEVDRLDPITVHLENHEPGKGKIGIECYGKSWSAYWGGMSGDPVEAFFIRCNPGYIIGNLAPGLQSAKPSLEGLADKVKAEVLTLRRAGELTEKNAREYWDDADGIQHLDSIDVLGYEHGDLLARVFGEEWWYSLPEEANPDYTYLHRIVEAVQDGLRQVIENDKAAA